jgi:hypothetical protein
MIVVLCVCRRRRVSGEIQLPKADAVSKRLLNDSFNPIPHGRKIRHIDTQLDPLI